VKRIPKEFRLEGDEVGIRRHGNALVIRPKKRSWTPLLESLDQFADDFMKEGRMQPPIQTRGRRPS
jgi:antitoxin VapB